MNRAWRLATACACLTLLVACGSSQTGGQASRGGGYYKDDGPGANIPANIASIPDAVPRIEAHRNANKRPYRVLGRHYTPIDGRAFRQTGVASWYGRKFHGNRTATGERYDMYAMTAAHPTLPLPSYARVTRSSNGRSVIVRINDRGPFHSNRIIDLSYAAAAKLGLIGPGSGQVIVEAITHDDIRRDAWRRGSDTTVAARTAPAPAPTRAAAPAPIVTAAPAPVLVATAPAPATTQAVSMPPPAARPAPVTPDALSALQHDALLRPASGPATPSPAPVSAPALASHRLFLQFGAFSLPDSAQQLAQRLNASLTSDIEFRAAEVRADTALHRVVIGPYASRTDAVNAAVRIAQATGKQPLITLMD